VYKPAQTPVPPLRTPFSFYFLLFPDFIVMRAWVRQALYLFG
jgi:hypothetical protein